MLNFFSSSSGVVSDPNVNFLGNRRLMSWFLYWFLTSSIPEHIFLESVCLSSFKAVCEGKYLIDMTVELVKGWGQFEPFFKKNQKFGMKFLILVINFLTISFCQSTAREVLKSFRICEFFTIFLKQNFLLNTPETLTIS